MGLNVAISTYDTFFSKIAEKCSAIPSEKMIVIDEAHNLSPKQIGLLPTDFPYRLGLRCYDKSETDKIINYFTSGKVETYKYTIDEVVAAGFLFHYLYYPLFVHLSADDFVG